MHKVNEFVSICNNFGFYFPNHCRKELALVLPFKRRKVVGVGDSTENRLINEVGNELLVVGCSKGVAINKIFGGVVLEHLLIRATLLNPCFFESSF